MTIIGILWPGAMGSALGRAWRSPGVEVVTSLDGRSARTRDLAGDLTALGSLEEVVRVCDAVVSVVPPAHAVTQAEQIAAAVRRTGSTPVVADLNAVSPATMGQVATVLEAVGCVVVDGAISGPPPRPDGDTALFLSGASCSPFADLAAPGLRAVVVGSEVGAASATKMSTAAVYKGTKALLLQSLLTARHHGVLDAVVADLSTGAPELTAHLARDLAVAASKSDRFPAEMREIASTQAAAGAGAELYEAVAEVFERADASTAGAATPEQAASATDLDAVLDALTRRR